MKNFLFYSLLCGFIFTGFGCEDCEDPTNPECENYDPCYDKVAANADFMISQKSLVIDPSTQDITYNILDTFQSDTVLLGHTVYFDAHDTEADRYEWHIGTDNRIWREPSFFLEFDKNDHSLLSNPLPVELVTQRQAYPDCFEGDNGLDTLKRFINFINQTDALYFGTWEGYYDNNTNKKYQIKIFWDENGGSYFQIHFENLFGENNGCIYNTSRYYLGYKEARMIVESDDNWNNCNPDVYYSGWLHLSVISQGSIDTLQIHLEQTKHYTTSSTNEKSTITFTGTRIQ